MKISNVEKAKNGGKNPSIVKIYKWEQLIIEFYIIIPKSGYPIFVMNNREIKNRTS